MRYPPPPASSTIESFPISTPVLSSFSSTVAVSSNTCAAYGFAPHVVSWPANASRSFAPNGMPCSGPRKRSRFNSSSTSLRASPQLRKRQSQRIVAGPEFLEPFGKGLRSSTVENSRFLNRAIEIGNRREKNIVRHALNWNAGSRDIGISNFARIGVFRWDSRAALSKSGFDRRRAGARATRQPARRRRPPQAAAG